MNIVKSICTAIIRLTLVLLFQVGCLVPGLSQGLSIGILHDQASTTILGDSLAENIKVYRDSLIAKNLSQRLYELDSLVIGLIKYEYEDKTRPAKEIARQGYAYNKELGQFEKGAYFMDMSLNLFQNQDSLDYTWIQWLLQHLGNIHTRSGEYTKAEYYLLKAIEINMANNDLVKASRVYSNLSIIFFSVGDIQKSVITCQKGIDLAKKTNHPYAEFINRMNLCSAFIELDSLEKAKHQVSICQKLLDNVDKDNKGFCKELLISTKADLYSSEGNYELTIILRDSLYQNYLANYKTTKRREFGKLHYQNAHSYLELGQLKESRYQIIAGLNSISYSSNPLVLNEDLYAENTFEQLYLALCEYYYAKYQTSNAPIYLDSIQMTVDKGVIIYHLINESLISNNAKVSNTSNKKVFASYGIEAIWYKSQHQELNSKDIIRIESLIDLATGSVLSEIQNLKKELKELPEAIRQEYLSNQSMIADFKQNRMQQQSMFRDSVLLLLERNKEIASEIMNPKTNIYTGNLIAYISSKTHLYSYCRNGNSKRLYQLATIGEAKKNVELAIQSITKPDNQDYFFNIKKLSEILIKPIQDLPNSFSIINDMHTIGIPFEVLLDKNDQNLLKNHTIDYRLNTSISSKSDMEYNSISLISPKYGGEYSGTSQNRSLIYPLLYSGREVQEISQWYKSCTIDTTMTANQLTTFLEHSDIIHYAGHARSFERECALILAGHNNIITEQIEGSTISTTPSNTNLAILSACETGVGMFAAGEGTLSLTRAFIEGGTPQVINSLWAVNDQTTYFIMTKFHEFLSNGLSPEKSLQAAKIDYLAQYTGEYAHPYYWAGFVVITSHQSAEYIKKTGYTFFVLISLSILLILYLYKRNN